MKSLLLAVATLVLGSSTALASPPGDTAPGDPPQARGRGEWKQRLQARFDTDHDGTLSPEERWVAKRVIRQRLKARFDRNQDGRIGPRERAAMRGALRAKRGERFDRLVQRLDKDGDGVIGPGEAPAGLRQRLMRKDRNGDGWLTRDEVMAPRMHREHGRGQLDR